MKISRLKTEKYHNYAEGDCGKPLSRKGKHLCYYKKKDWKRIDRKKYLKQVIRDFDLVEIITVEC